MNKVMFAVSKPISTTSDLYPPSCLPLTNFRDEPDDLGSLCSRRPSKEIQGVGVPELPLGGGPPADQEHLLWTLNE